MWGWSRRGVRGRWGVGPCCWRRPCHSTWEWNRRFLLHGQQSGRAPSRLAAVYQTASGAHNSGWENGKHLWAARKEEGGKCQMEGKRRLKKCYCAGKWKKKYRKTMGWNSTLSFGYQLQCFRKTWPHAPWLCIPITQGWKAESMQDSSGIILLVCMLPPGLLLTEGLSGFKSRQHVTDWSLDSFESTSTLHTNHIIPASVMQPSNK